MGDSFEEELDDMVDRHITKGDESVDDIIDALDLKLNELRDAYQGG